MSDTPFECVGHTGESALSGRAGSGKHGSIPVYLLVYTLPMMGSSRVVLQSVYSLGREEGGAPGVEGAEEADAALNLLEEKAEDDHARHAVRLL